MLRGDFWPTLSVHDHKYPLNSINNNWMIYNFPSNGVFTK